MKIYTKNFHLRGKYLYIIWIMLKEILGYAGVIFAVAMYAPQAFKTFKEKRVEGLSKVFFLIIIFGTTGWIFYGAFNNRIDVWLSNLAVSLLMYIIIWFLFSKKEKIIIYGLLVPVQIASLLILLLWKTDLSDGTNMAITSLAGIGTSSGLFAQIYTTYKTKDVKNISSLMLIFIMLNQILWTIVWALNYADDHKVDQILGLIWSALPIFSSTFLLFMKKKYDKK